jgi:hypothetical protein
MTKKNQKLKQQLDATSSSLFPTKNMPFPAKYAISGSIRSIWPFSGSIE